MDEIVMKAFATYNREITMDALRIMRTDIVDKLICHLNTSTGLQI